MHIHPIRAGREAWFPNPYAVPRGNYFYNSVIDHKVLQPSSRAPVVVAGESSETRAFAEMLRTGLALHPATSAIQTLFLRMAIAGFFPRQKYVVDWQALHGNWIHYGGSHRHAEGLGQSLDIVI